MAFQREVDSNPARCYSNLATRKGSESREEGRGRRRGDVELSRFFTYSRDYKYFYDGHARGPGKLELSHRTPNKKRVASRRAPLPPPPISPSGLFVLTNARAQATETQLATGKNSSADSGSVCVSVCVCQVPFSSVDGSQSG